MNRKKFYDSVRGSLFGGSLSQGQVEGMENLLDVWEKYFSDGWLHELAYDLATAWWETGQTMQPIYERGPRSYFDKYEPGTRIGSVLGNTQKGDGYRFRGQGHVQNTGRRNASVATNRINEKFQLGVNLVQNPEKRGDPFISAISLFLGNREGWWTGRDISDYIDSKDEDDDEDLREFVNSRRIVNGTDKAVTIAKAALKFEAALKAAGYKPGKPPVVAPIPQPSPIPEAPAPDPQPVTPVRVSLWERIKRFMGFA